MRTPQTRMHRNRFQPRENPPHPSHPPKTLTLMTRMPNPRRNAVEDDGVDEGVIEARTRATPTNLGMTPIQRTLQTSPRPRHPWTDRIGTNPNERNEHGEMSLTAINGRSSPSPTRLRRLPRNRWLTRRRQRRSQGRFMGAACAGPRREVDQALDQT
jgi:hypothetical protein